MTQRENPADPTWMWDRYWASDRVAACLKAADPNYSGHLRTVWEAHFRGLSDGARILDVATGNGAIAIVANEVSRSAGKAFEIHGVDSAGIDPTHYVRSRAEELAGIHFHPRTPAEDLPFEDDYFDVVTGHYALEYTDMLRSVHEIARVLKPGGLASFVLHSDDSFVTAGTHRQLDLIGLVLEETAVVERVRDLLEIVYAPEHGGVSAPDDAKPGFVEAKQAFDEAAKRVFIEMYRQGEPVDFLSDTMQMLAEIYQRRTESTLEETLAALDDIVAEIQAHRARLEAQKTAALSSETMTQLRGLFERAGFTNIEHSPLYERYPDRLAGWHLRATLADPAQAVG